MHIDRKRLREYVRLRTNKVLRSKDLFNIAAANKQKRIITPERAYQLIKKIHDIEKMQARNSNRKIYPESEDEIAQTIKRMKKEQETAWGQDVRHKYICLIFAFSYMNNVEKNFVSSGIIDRIRSERGKRW